MVKKIWAVILMIALVLTCAAPVMADDIDEDDIDFSALDDVWGDADEYVPEDEEYDDETYDEELDEEEFDEEEYEEEVEDSNDADTDENGDPVEEEQFIDELIASIEENSDALDAVNGMTNILLIGTDARPGQTTGRSDTMILMTLDAESNCIKLISFMRDLYVEIPGKKNNRLNAAYVFGGPELLIKTLKKNFGVSVDFYVAVDFSLLADVIDQIGGLTLTVESKYLKRLNAVIKMDNKVLGIDINTGLLEEAGEQHMTGRQVEAYARYRYGSSDFDRTTRQREVILKGMEKIKSMSLTELASLAMNNMDKITTNMSLSDMVSIAPAAFQLLDAEVREMRVPIDGCYTSKTISKMAVLVPDRSATLKKITSFLLG